MQSYPHHYSVDASARDTGQVTLTAEGLPALQTAPPAQFDGPGDQWSPETLLIAAIADCFVLTFRAIARASNLAWATLRCHATGQLDRIEGGARFTHVALHASLIVPAATDTGKARRLLEKAEKTCLITNSLAVTPTLVCEVHPMPSEAIASQ